jgi:hypothetical protein
MNEAHRLCWFFIMMKLSKVLLFVFELRHTIYGEGIWMKSDQVRREYKKTLWGEELDNERHSNPVSSSLEFESLQIQGKKHPCKNCGQEYEGNRMFHTNQGKFCSKCYPLGLQVGDQ